MRALMLCAAFAALVAAPLLAIDEGQQSLQGVVKWVPSNTQQGAEDLAIVIGSESAESSVRFWSGGSVDTSQLEDLVGRQVGVDGKVHKYMDAMYVTAEKLSLPRGAEAPPAAPRTALSLEDKASGLAASWFKARHDGEKLEPVARVKAVDGNQVEVAVMGQDADGTFKAKEKVRVNMERISVQRIWE